MATEELFQLIFEAKGQQAITDAEAQLAAVGGKVATLNAQFNAGQITEDKWRAGLQKQAGEMSRLKDEIEGLNKAAGNGTSKMAGFGQTMLQSGRFVQDFAQGGLGGVLNNIEGVTQALGLGSGLAGAFTIVGVAVMLLKPKIEEFLKSLSTGGVKEFASQLETLNARIKELEGKPHKLTVDTIELETAKQVVDQIKAALAEVDKLRKGQAHYEGESGKAIGEMVAEAPGGSQGVHQSLRDAMQGQALDNATGPIRAEMAAVQAKIDDDLRAAANLDAAGQSGAAARLRGQAEGRKGELEQLDEQRLAAVNDVMKPGGALDQKIGQVLGTAKTGAGVAQADAQRTLAEMLGKAGLGNLAEGVRASSPAQLLANDQADEDLEASIQAQKDGIARRNAAAKKAAAGPAADTPVRVRSLGQAGAAAAGPGQAPKGKIDSDAARRAALLQSRANQIQDRSAALTGVQFSPEQSQHVAAESVKLQGKGLDANRATLVAMQRALAAMQKIAMQQAAQQQQAQQLGNGFAQLNQEVNARARTQRNRGRGG